MKGAKYEFAHPWLDSRKAQYFLNVRAFPSFFHVYFVDVFESLLLFGGRASASLAMNSIDARRYRSNGLHVDRQVRALFRIRDLVSLQQSTFVPALTSRNPNTNNNPPHYHRPRQHNRTGLSDEAAAFVKGDEGLSTTTFNVKTDYSMLGVEEVGWVYKQWDRVPLDGPYSAGPLIRTWNFGRA